MAHWLVTQPAFLRKLTDRALYLVAQGEISRAVHVLQSTGIAEANDATADLLRLLLCPNPSQPAPSRSWIQKRQDAAASISPRHFLRTLRKAAKGGACDLTGWHYKQLQLSLGKKSTFSAVLQVCDLLAKGRLSTEFYDMIAIGRVTPLKKGLKNKLRPLVCGSTWRRITMSTLCQAHK